MVAEASKHIRAGEEVRNNQKLNKTDPTFHSFHFSGNPKWMNFWEIPKEALRLNLLVVVCLAFIAIAIAIAIAIVEG